MNALSPILRWEHVFREDVEKDGAILAQLINLRYTAKWESKRCFVWVGMPLFTNVELATCLQRER